jgi:hypothetical protein
VTAVGPKRRRGVRKPAVRRPRRLPAGLAVLLAVALVEAVAWACVMPPLQGPDEVGHFAYTQKIVEAGEIPWRAVGWAPEAGTPPYSTEMDRALVAAAILPSWANPAGRPASTQLEERRWDREQERLTDEERADGGFTSSMANPPAYYLYESIPYALASSTSIFDRALLLRLANLPLLIVLVVFCWLIAGRLLGGSRWLQTVATAAVVLQPQVTHLAATANPDIALAAIWSAALYVMLRTLETGLSGSRIAWLVGLVALSGLTQPRGLALLVPAVATVALAWRRHGSGGKRAVPLGLVVAGAGGVLLLVLYAMQWDVSVSRTRQFASYLWQFYLPRLGFMDPSISPGWGVKQAFIDRLFGGYAQLEIAPPAWVQTALAIGAVAVIVLALVGVWVRRRSLARRPEVAVVCALLVFGYVFVLHVVAFRSLLDAADPIITGRYLLPLMPLYGVAFGLAVSWLPRRVALSASAVVLAALAVIQLEAFALLWERFYA